MKKCFAPWIDSQTRILIVGTMPSEISLAQNMYYANPQNRFWKYMGKILNEDLLGASKEKRKDMLLSHKIGLWDALSFCEREGSLDANIKQEKPNNFNSYPQIKFYAFNGQKAFAFFKKYNSDLLKTDNYIVLPSTSPANASIKDEIKFKLWQESIGKYDFK